MNLSSIKLSAKRQIQGNILMYFLATCVASIVGSISFGFLAPVLSFFGGFWGMGFIYLANDMRDGKGASIERIFSPFKDFVRIFVSYLLMGIFFTLWSFLFIIPGIIKYFSYSMTPFILADNPNITSIQAISKSREIMDGHKMDLFLLKLSFIGWYILVACTLGLALIYVAPYYLMAHQNFYDQRKGDYTGSSNSNFKYLEEK